MYEEGMIAGDARTVYIVVAEVRKIDVKLFYIPPKRLN